MQKSHSAFTMIELIFVIVILGILAGVAIPKLIATRDDAEVVKIASNVMLGAGEIASYATSKGIVDTDLAVMSNGLKALENSGDAVLSASQATIAVGGVSDCVSVIVDSNITTGTDTLNIVFGTPGNDIKCTSIQSAIDAQQYPMKLRGTTLF